MTNANEHPSDAPDADAAEIRESTMTVEVERSVRYNRLLILGLVIGAVAAALIAASLPVSEDAEYSLAQAVGFAAVLGAALGLVIGGLVGIILNQLAKRKHGTAVAVQTDVR